MKPSTGPPESHAAASKVKAAAIGTRSRRALMSEDSLDADATTLRREDRYDIDANVADVGAHRAVVAIGDAVHDQRRAERLDEAVDHEEGGPASGRVHGPDRDERSDDGHVHGHP